MLFKLVAKIAEALGSCCGWAQEGRRKFRERWEHLEKMSDDEFFAYLKKQARRSRKLCPTGSCC